MDAIECIRTRMSIRRFRPDPVPKDLLMSIVETALRSPSYKNSQPWEVAIVSGKKKEALTEILLNLLEKGERPCPDLPEPLKWPEHLEERIKNHLMKRAEFMGIDITSPEAQKKAKRANFKFYGAPHGLFLFQDSVLTEWSILDMGMFAQTLMLAAHAHGLGTVPQAFLTDYSQEVKRFLGIPESKRLILGISIGYPDMSDRANSYRSDRVKVDEILKWLE
ncbi:MAG: nitroreductase [Thermodesulfovibrionales bacterium]